MREISYTDVLAKFETHFDSAFGAKVPDWINFDAKTKFGLANQVFLPTEISPTDIDYGVNLKQLRNDVIKSFYDRQPSNFHSAAETCGQLLGCHLVTGAINLQPPIEFESRGKNNDRMQAVKSLVLNGLSESTNITPILRNPVITEFGVGLSGLASYVKVAQKGVPFKLRAIEANKATIAALSGVAEITGLADRVEFLHSDKPATPFDYKKLGANTSDVVVMSRFFGAGQKVVSEAITAAADTLKNDGTFIINGPVSSNNPFNPTLGQQISMASSRFNVGQPFVNLGYTNDISGVVEECALVSLKPKKGGTLGLSLR